MSFTPRTPPRGGGRVAVGVVVFLMDPHTPSSFLAGWLGPAETLPFIFSPRPRWYTEALFLLVTHHLGPRAEESEKEVGKDFVGSRRFRSGSEGVRNQDIDSSCVPPRKPTHGNSPPFRQHTASIGRKSRLAAHSYIAASRLLCGGSREPPFCATFGAFCGTPRAEKEPSLAAG